MAATVGNPYDPRQYVPFAEAADNYGVEGTTPWSNNFLARDMLVFPSGQVGRTGTAAYEIAASELELCRRISAEAHAEANACALAGESDGALHPFFIAAPRRGWRIRRITPRFVRQAFGGTIWPGADVIVESLDEPTRLWTRIHENLADTPESNRASRIAEWRHLVEWFKQNPSLKESAWVEIGQSEYDCGAWRSVTYALRNILRRESAGSVLPRLLVGLTPAGSLAGLCCTVVES